jgi:peptidoglycan/xylan/chitin deacetylase (PgdA/CDA1 family)
MKKTKKRTSFRLIPTHPPATLSFFHVIPSSLLVIPAKTGIQLLKKIKKNILKKINRKILNLKKINRKRTRKKAKKNITLTKFIFPLLILIAIATFIPHQTKPTLETPYNQNQELPLDVKHLLLQKPTTTPRPYTLNLLNTTPAPKPLDHSIRVPILMYHYVEYVQDKNDKFREDLNINPDVFEQQVKTLVRSGYTFMTAKELGDVLNGKTKLPKKPVLLTFDDGHWDLATDVLPILEKYHAKATAYIIPGFIGQSDFMSPDQLKEVINSGLIDVGAHTVDHIALKDNLYPIVKYEIEHSKTMLEKTYNLNVVSFAYPYGSFDLQAINAAEKAGFTTAVSTIPGIEQNQQNKFFLYRLRPGYRTGQELLTFLGQKVFLAY